MIRVAMTLLALVAVVRVRPALDDQPPNETRQSTKTALAGTVPVEGAATDIATGLPTRIVHSASGIVLVLVPAGEFSMGSPEGEAGRGKAERVHRRVIRKPFYLGETEVTVAQFRKFVQATRYETDAERGTPDGGHGRGAFATVPQGEREWNAIASWQNPFPNLPDVRTQDDHPVAQVSWNDAQKFCSHYELRLPSEAQWEYACRAGNQSRFPWGETEAGGIGHANVADHSRKKRFSSTNVLFPFDDGAALLSAVGKYKPNSWGLRDMIGNVEEWCQDARLPYPEDGADETPAEGGPEAARVLRGGSWVSNAVTGRSATRIGMTPASRRDFQGFRVARAVDP